MTCETIASARGSLCALFVVSSSIVACGTSSADDVDFHIWTDAAFSEQEILPIPGLRPGELACPQPIANTNTICGRLINAETGEFLKVDGGCNGTLCSDIPAEDRTGPCLLEVSFFDALGFAQNPTGTTPLPADEIVINDCGWYRGVNVPTPALGFAGVMLDDALGSLDDWVPSFSGSMDGGGGCGGWLKSDRDDDNERPTYEQRVEAVPGDRIQGIDLLAIPTALVEAWTVGAASPFGDQTFAEKGALLVRFHRGGAPVAGVAITRDPAGVVPSDDFYFADSDPNTLTTVVPSDPDCEPGPGCQPVTGANGAVLMVNCPLVDHGGEGGTLPDECLWESGLAKNTPGTIWTWDRMAVDWNGDECL